MKKNKNYNSNKRRNISKLTIYQLDGKQKTMRVLPHAAKEYEEARRKLKATLEGCPSCFKGFKMMKGGLL